MIVLAITDPSEKAFLPKLNSLLGTNKVLAYQHEVEYATELPGLVRKSKCDVIVCSQQQCVEHLLSFCPTFRHPESRKQLTLADYAGSYFTITLPDNHSCDVLVVNPLRHTVTVPYGLFLLKRHLSKINAPHTWLKQTQFTWETCVTDADFQRLLNIAKHATFLTIDLETGPSELRNIVCAGYCAYMSNGDTHSWVVPIDDLTSVERMRAFNAAPPPKCTQGGEYDAVYLLRYNAPMYNWCLDTMHTFHSWYSELPKDLATVAAFLVREIRYWKDDGKGSNKVYLHEYCARDCWATTMAMCALLKELPEWARNNYIGKFPKLFPAIQQEMDGLKVDFDRLEVSKADAETKAGHLLSRLQARIHPKFNPRSSQQVKKLLTLFGCKDLESSDEATLNVAATRHPVLALLISDILEYRGVAKLVSTYLQPDKMWNGKLLYRTNPSGTDTNRLASTESSFWCGLQIQNIPRGPEVKCWVTVDPPDTSHGGEPLEWFLAEADKAQSEARCVGYISGCTSLIDLVESDKDYHSWNAQAFFGVPYEQIYDPVTKKTLDKPLRDLSKRTNHGANYNMGAMIMLLTMGPAKVLEARRLLKLPQSMSLKAVCQYLLDRYAKTYPEVKGDWYDWIKRTIKLTHKLVGATGWTRYFFADPASSKPSLNAAVAHAPQNLSAEILNNEWYAIWHRALYGDFRGFVRIKANIHDSVFFAYKLDYDKKVLALMDTTVLVKDIKGVVRQMQIPTDLSSGKKYWSELK